MKKVFLIISTLLCVFLFSACHGFNSLMYRHLSDQQNYEIYQVKLLDIYYYDPNTGEKINDFEDEDFLDHDIIFKVVFDNYEDVAEFLGAKPNQNISLTDYTFQLQVIEENNKALANNGFYKNFSLNETIEIKASNYIYMDANFFYIADVKYDENQYLNIDEGLANIIDMIDDNRSLF